MRSPTSGRLPMWNERLRPLCDTSLFWHSVWKSAGRPPRDALADIMRNTRAKYHRAAKQLRAGWFQSMAWRKRKDAITRAKIGPNLYRHIGSVGHSYLGAMKYTDSCPDYINGTREIKRNFWHQWGKPVDIDQQGTYI